MSDWPLNRSETRAARRRARSRAFGDAGRAGADGPSVELVADTLAAVDRAAVDYERPIPLSKGYDREELDISAGVLSAPPLRLLIVALTPSSPTFADAIESVQKATCRVVTKTQNDRHSPMVVNLTLR